MRTDPKKMIVLCLDIDGTLINKKTEEGFIFNGSEHPNNANPWLLAMHELSNHCSKLKVQFIVQIISSKKNASIDGTVFAVQKHLKPYLLLHDHSGHARHACLDFTSTYVLRHLGKTITPRSILPPIHLCAKNNIARPELAFSKALVMKSISEFFGGIPENNLFLLDDSTSSFWDLSTGSDSSMAERYQFIEAFDFRGTDGKEIISPSEALNPFNNVIERLKQTVKTRANEISQEASPRSRPTPLSHLSLFLSRHARIHSIENEIPVQNPHP